MRHARPVGSALPGARRPPQDRELPHSRASTNRTRYAQGGVETAGCTQVQQLGPGFMQEGEDACGTVRGMQVEVGHAPPEQRVFRWPRS